MGNFFIDIDNGAGIVRDDDGTDFVDREAAGREVNSALPEIAKDNQLRGSSHDIIAYLRDETGKVILTATLALTTKWIT